MNMSKHRYTMYREREGERVKQREEGRERERGREGGKREYTEWNFVNN